MFDTSCDQVPLGSKQMAHKVYTTRLWMHFHMSKSPKVQIFPCLTCKNEGKPVEIYTQRNFAFIFTSRKLQKYRFFASQSLCAEKYRCHFAFVFRCQKPLLYTSEKLCTSKIYKPILEHPLSTILQLLYTSLVLFDLNFEGFDS